MFRVLVLRVLEPKASRALKIAREHINKLGGQMQDTINEETNGERLRMCCANTKIENNDYVAARLVGSKRAHVVSRQSKRKAKQIHNPLA